MKGQNLKKNIYRIIISILLIWTFFIIFGFSNQNGKESSGISKKITQIITTNIKYIQNLEENQKNEITNRIEKIIRKLAHFSIYTLVGLLLMILVNTYNLKLTNKIAITSITGIIYAISDEIHQSFIPGRSPQVTDVLIDTMGVILGILLVILVIKIKEKNVETCQKKSWKNTWYKKIFIVE